MVMRCNVICVLILPVLLSPYQIGLQMLWGLCGDIMFWTTSKRSDQVDMTVICFLFQGVHPAFIGAQYPYSVTTPSLAATAVSFPGVPVPSMTQIAVHPYHSETGLSLSSNVASKCYSPGLCTAQVYLPCSQLHLSQVLPLIDHRWSVLALRSSDQIYPSLKMCMLRGSGTHNRT